MNKSFKISVSVFLIVTAKVIIDIVLFVDLLEKISQVNVVKLITVTLISGFISVLIFNKLQRFFTFVVAVSFVFYLILVQYMLYYGHPLILDKDNTMYAIPAFIIIGNLLLYQIFKGISLRISSEEFSPERIINLAKYAGLILGSAITAYLIFIKKIDNLSFYYVGSLLLLLLGYYYFINLLFSCKNSNNIIENALIVRQENKFKLLATHPLFVIMLLTTMVITLLIAFSFKLYLTNTLIKYNNFRDLGLVFCGYTAIIGILGELYELFLRRKLVINLGIRNVLAFFPVFVTILAGLFIMNRYTNFFSKGEDWKFIYLLLTSFMMIFTHFSFENITMQTNYSFYQPIGVEKRQDFFNKSFFSGILAGTGISSIIVLYIYRYFQANQIIILAFTALALVALLFFLNSIPVYNIYRKELQRFLNVQSKKVIIQKGIFKDLETNPPDNFKGMQFVRYLNLLNLSNPVLSRKAIEKTIQSDDNLIQKTSLIKAGNMYMLETSESLQSLTKTKYFPSSPNRDKIMMLINRFTEVNERMNNKHYIYQLSISKKDKERVFGAKLAYFSEADEKNDIIIRLLKDRHLPAVINAIISAQQVDYLPLIKQITKKLDTPALGNAAYSALLSCGKVILPILEETFYETGQTEKSQIRIIRLYGEIANSEATEYLIKKLNISNQNIISATLSALSKCKLILSEEKTALIKHELEELCYTLVQNMSLSIDIGHHQVGKELGHALKVEIDSNFDSMFNLLSLLYDSRSVQLIRNNLFSYDFEKISFALELASVLLKDEIKLLVLPLLQPLTLEEKVEIMQDQIPTEKLLPKEVLYTLIQRDSKWTNQWTKACALTELIKEKDKKEIPILLANMVNPDTMISEISAVAIMELDEELYYRNKKIFGEKYTSLFAPPVLKQIEATHESKKNYPVLKFDIIKSLRSINEFSGISGEVLKKLTDHIVPIQLKMGDILDTIHNVEVQHYFYILYSGIITLRINKSFLKSFGEKTFISTLDILPDETSEIELSCEKDAVVYRIEPYGFIELLTIYDIIPESVLRKTQNEKLKEYAAYIRNGIYQMSQLSTMNNRLYVREY